MDEVSNGGFDDNLSTNAYEGASVLVAFNTPRTNLGVAQDEYRAELNAPKGTISGQAISYCKNSAGESGAFVRRLLGTSRLVVFGGSGISRNRGPQPPLMSSDRCWGGVV
jgi:hypothetical protein